MRRLLPLATTVPLALLLALPMDVTALRYPWFWAPPLELILVAALALACGPQRARIAGFLAVLSLGPMLLLALLEALVFQLFGRPLRLAADLPLLPIAIEAIRLGSVPGWLPVLALLLGLLVLLLLAGLCWGFGVGWARLPSASHRRAAWRLAAAGLTALALDAALGPGTPHWRVVATDGIGRLLLQLRHYRELQQARARLERAIAEDPLHPASTLPGLWVGVDVVVLFVESYGQVALDRSPFAEMLRPRLAVWQERLARLGFAPASGLLESPTIGGQSWLAHATLLAGLTIDHESAWQLLLHRDRRSTLAHLFQRSGHRTLLAMPAVGGPWPESARLGFASFLPAPAFGYAGPPFGFAPVPDQFALAVLAREWFGATRPLRPPLFALVVLATSHAPFTPVPQLVPWEELGDGRVLARFSTEAEPAAELWRQPERLRAAYSRALGYSLDAAFAFAARILQRCTLVLILGDHPPAAAISGDHRRTVPIHVLAGDPVRLAVLRARLGLLPGLLPLEQGKIASMAELRDLFAGTRSEGGEACAQGGWGEAPSRGLAPGS
ncbi:hypothetical protein HRbin40_02482 [bacterium HR40]|nr:hypothetical protein HRbin40_02482 [bacterium HR40]